MRKYFILFGLMFAFYSCASASNSSYVPGNIFNTTVSNSTTASSWVLLNGSVGKDGNYTDYKGRLFPISAYEIIPSDGTSDFSFAFTNSPSAYATWRASYGPMRDICSFPDTGLWVCLTPTAGSVSLQLIYK
jgi:hypothetical protein